MPLAASAEMFLIPVRHSLNFLPGYMLCRPCGSHQTRGCGVPELLQQDLLGIFAHTNGIGDPGL